jgi:hypothetical protein
MADIHRFPPRMTHDYERLRLEMARVAERLWIEMDRMDRETREACELMARIRASASRRPKAAAIRALNRRRAQRLKFF